jgi:transposase, IS6 family
METPSSSKTTASSNDVSNLGFFSFETAWNTLQGYEVMNMVRKGQMRGVEKGDILGQIALIAHLFGVAA